MKNEDGELFDRLNKTPDRMVFKVDVGNMSQKESEELIKKLRQKFRDRDKK